MIDGISGQYGLSHSRKSYQPENLRSIGHISSLDPFNIALSLRNPRTGSVHDSTAEDFEFVFCTFPYTKDGIYPFKTVKVA